MDETPQLLTLPQAAAMLNIGRTTLYELMASGELDSVKIGRLRRVPRAAIPECIARRRRAASAKSEAA